jgi:hypothetical protein
MKTAGDFQIRFWSGFENSDLGNDLEKHLTNIQDGNNVPMNYGIDDNTEQHYFEVGDTSYNYVNKLDRDFDMAFFDKVVKEFKAKQIKLQAVL